MTFEILAIIVIINAVATIELWRRAARQPEKLKKKFRDDLWRGKPITPKHEPPPPPEADRVMASKMQSVSPAISKILRTSSIGAK